MNNAQMRDRNIRNWETMVLLRENLIVPETHSIISECFLQKKWVSYKMGLKINLHIKIYELVSIIRNQSLRSTLIKGESETDHLPINVCPLFTDQESQNFFCPNSPLWCCLECFGIGSSAFQLSCLARKFPNSFGIKCWSHSFFRITSPSLLMSRFNVYSSSGLPQYFQAKNRPKRVLVSHYLIHRMPYLKIM